MSAPGEMPRDIPKTLDHSEKLPAHVSHRGRSRKLLLLALTTGLNASLAGSAAMMTPSSPIAAPSSPQVAERRDALSVSVVEVNRQLREVTDLLRRESSRHDPAVLIPVEILDVTLPVSAVENRFAPNLIKIGEGMTAIDNLENYDLKVLAQYRRNSRDPLVLEIHTRRLRRSEAKDRMMHLVFESLERLKEIVPPRTDTDPPRQMTDPRQQMIVARQRFLENLLLEMQRHWAQPE